MTASAGTYGRVVRLAVGPDDATHRRLSKDQVGRLSVGLVALVWVAALGLGFTWALPVLTGLGFAGAIAGLRRPMVGILGITLLATLEAVNRIFLLGGGILRWNTLNYWLLLVAVLALPWLLRLRDPSTRTLQMFLAVLAVGLVFSSTPMSGVQQIIEVSSIFGLLFYFSAVAGDVTARYWAGMMGGVCGALGGLVFFLQREGLPEANQNVWAYFPLTAMFAVCLAFPAAARRRKGEIILGGLATTCFAWLFLIGSRGGIATGLMALAFLTMATSSLSKRVVMLILGLLLTLAVASQFPGMGDETVERIRQLFDSSLSASERTNARAEIATGAWHLFLDNPIGVGTGDFAAELQRSRYAVKTYEAHSGWAKTIAENGIPGVAALVAWLGSLAVVGFNRPGRRTHLLGLLAAVALAVALTSVELQHIGLLYLAAGATATLRRAASERALPGAPRRVVGIGA